MKTLLLLLATCMGLSATNWSSCPGAVTTVGSYDLTQDLVTSSTYCIEVATTNAGNLTIDCHGYRVKSPTYPLYVHDNVANVSWTNCTFQTTNTGVGGYVIIKDNTAGTNSYQNLYALNGTNNIGTVDVIDSPYAYFDYDGTSSTMIWIRGNTFYRSRYSHVHNSSIYLRSITYTHSGGIWVNSPNVTLIGNIIEGDTNSQYLDDCIILENTSNSQVSSNTCNYVFDSGIELFGATTNTTINNNDTHYYKIAGISCYYDCNINGSTFHHNTVDHVVSGYSTASILLNGDVNSGGGTFTNNTVTENDDLDGSSLNAQFGRTTSGSTGWSTISGNYMANNDFRNSHGSGVLFQSASGWSDGGGNLCTTASPGAITCH